jgi:MFS family permease
MLEVLRKRNFALLWTGGLISFIGDWILFISLPLYILQLTGSVLAMGIGFLVNLVPMFVLGSVGGVFADRWDRRKVLVWSNLALAPLYSCLLLFDSPDTVWVSYLVLFTGNVIRQVLNPAENALLPRLVGDEHLVAANALNSLNNNLARLIGPAVGGIAFATLGFRTAVLMDVATFLIAAALIALISAPREITRAHHEHDHDGKPARRNMKAEWLEGLKVVRERPVLAGLLTVIGISNLADGVITVMFAPYVTRALDGGSPELGWLMTAQAVGGLIGGAFIGRVGKKVAAWQMIAYGFVLLGVFDVLVFGMPVLWSNIVLLALVGIPVVGIDVGAMTLFQRNSEDRVRGRVMGLYSTTVAFCTLVGRSFATLAGDIIDIVPLLISMGIVLALAGVAAFRLLREHDRLAVGSTAKPQPQTESGG